MNKPDTAPLSARPSLLSEPPWTVATELAMILKCSRCGGMARLQSGDELSPSYAGVMEHIYALVCVDVTKCGATSGLWVKDVRTTEILTRARENAAALARVEEKLDRVMTYLTQRG